ncbi:hypothetical protein QJUYFBOH_CDS0082 [Escherichia phage SHIN8]
MYIKSTFFANVRLCIFSVALLQSCRCNSDLK